MPDFGCEPAGTSAPARDLLRVLTCGSVDDGKSTLLGRLLFEAGAVPADVLEQVRRDSARRGEREPDWSLLVDGLEAEREQGITIDVAYRFFSTPRRAFIVADTPGHEQYTRNMATGASTAELAVLLVDARKGLLPQTRRHAAIASLLGVRRAVLAVNKMDLVGWSEAAFRTIADAFAPVAEALGLHVTALPQEAAAHADTIFLGPGEQTFPQFLADFRAQRPSARYDSRGGRTIHGLPPCVGTLSSGSATSFRTPLSSPAAARSTAVSATRTPSSPAGAASTRSGSTRP